MGQLASNVSTSKPKVGGAVWYAPTGTTLPTTATEDLDKAFVCLGYISEDGITNAYSQEFEDIKAWGGDTVDSSLSETTDTFSYKLIEVLNENVQKYFYGSDNVSGSLTTGNMTVSVTGDEPDHYSLVCDMVLKGNVAHRIVVADHKITEREEIAYTDSDAVAYGVTCTAYPDANGKYHKHMYSK